MLFLFGKAFRRRCVRRRTRGWAEQGNVMYWNGKAKSRGFWFTEIASWLVRGDDKCAASKYHLLNAFIHAFFGVNALLFQKFVTI